MGLTITIIEFAIWPGMPKTQSLNHAIKPYFAIHAG